MAKPCKYKDVETGACSCEKHYRDKDGINHCVMEPYTTERCNMKIRPKPAKMSKVKAWAHIYGENNRWVDVSQFKGSDFTIPCTILISEKYLGRKNV